MKKAASNVKNNRLIYEVVRFFESSSGLSKALGVTHPSVSQWLKDGKFPKLRCYQIEVCTKGRYKAKDLLTEK